MTQADQAQEATMTKRPLFLSFAILVPFLVVALAGCKGGSQASGPGPDQAVILQDPAYIMGAGLYSRNCAGCHGDGGRGQASLGPQINTPDWQASHSDADIRDAILQGRKVPGTSMDTFQGALSDDEISALIVYIRTLTP
jgi:mono/diheme cytochrome c family protein